MCDPAMNALYQTYAGTLYRFLFCLTWNRFLAEELSQETILQALRTINRFRFECRIDVWRCQIAKGM